MHSTQNSFLKGTWETLNDMMDTLSNSLTTSLCLRCRMTAFRYLDFPWNPVQVLARKAPSLNGMILSYIGLSFQS